MANYVPFEQLKVGESYYMYSSYWGKTLGIATIAELEPSSGTGSAYGDWGESKGPFCFGVDDGFYNSTFWDSEPTTEEVQYQKYYGKKYVPPRVIGGKNYDGGPIITGELKELLDKFVVELDKAFHNNPCFKRDKRDSNVLFIWESKLRCIRPSEVFITSGGKCDWDLIRYVQKKANVHIHSAERDSCGWLIGAIDKKMPDGSIKRILYG